PPLVTGPAVVPVPAGSCTERGRLMAASAGEASRPPSARPRNTRLIMNVISPPPPRGRADGSARPSDRDRRRPPPAGVPPFRGGRAGGGGWRAKAARACARGVGSPTGPRVPVTASSTSSPLPPTRVATTGRPLAI